MDFNKIIITDQKDGDGDSLYTIYELERDGEIISYSQDYDAMMNWAIDTRGVDDPDLIVFVFFDDYDNAADFIEDDDLFEELASI